jgi:hypothetical protein
MSVGYHGSMIDLTGQRFGRLVALRESLPRQRQRAWICQCDCGAIRICLQSNLRKPGHTQSCGCLQREQIGARSRVHGHKPTRGPTKEYARWLAMCRRCNNPKHAQYEGYGGRGITVCPRWRFFATFLADMGPAPTPQHSLDRIDNDGPYSPENCRWATSREQCNNRSTNHRIEMDGQVKTLSEWAALLDTTSARLCQRIECGWTEEMAVTTPVIRARNLEHDGLSLTIEEWAARLGIPSITIHWRLRHGRTVAEALEVSDRQIVRKIEHEGLCLTIPEWGARLGIAPKTIRWRLNHGWSPSKTLTVSVRQVAGRNQRR